MTDPTLDRDLLSPLRALTLAERRQLIYGTLIVPDRHATPLDECNRLAEEADEKVRRFLGAMP